MRRILIAAALATRLRGFGIRSNYRVLCGAGYHHQEVHHRGPKTDNDYGHAGRPGGVQDSSGSRGRYEDNQGLRVEVNSSLMKSGGLKTELSVFVWLVQSGKSSS